MAVEETADFMGMNIDFNLSTSGSFEHMHQAVDLWDGMLDTFSDVTRRAGFTKDSINSLTNSFGDLLDDLPTVAEMLKGVKDVLPDIGVGLFGLLHPKIVEAAATLQEQIINLKNTAQGMEEVADSLAKAARDLAAETKGVFDPVATLQVAQFWANQGEQIDEVILKLVKYGEVFSQVTHQNRFATADFMRELKTTLGMSEPELVTLLASINAVKSLKGIPGFMPEDIQQILRANVGALGIINPEARTKAMGDIIGMAGALKAAGFTGDVGGIFNQLLVGLQAPSESAGFQRIAKPLSIAGVPIEPMQRAM